MKELSDELSEYLRGLAAAVLQGGAAAVTGAFAVGVNDPYYSLGSAASYALMWKLFLVSGTLGGMAYLRQKDLPKHMLVEKTVKTVAEQPAGTVTTVVKETHTEPAP